MNTLKKTIFWDVDLRKLDFRKHKKFIIERILQYGDLEDYHLAIAKFGAKEIKKNLLKSGGLNKKSLFFWNFIYNIKEKQCVRNQSTGRQDMFSKR